MVMKPTTIAEVQQIVQEAKRLPRRHGDRPFLPRGNGTKPALSTPSAGVDVIEMSGLSGMIEYQPGEYTFTAYAGTAVSEIAHALAEHGQYLPFDPPLVGRGATLGGVVAANTSGSGRYRYGGVRDFILGVRFVDGNGRLVRSGGKVVKNSAGFDLSKFMVGSMGQYGILVELSFKVFPKSQVSMTLLFRYANLETALQAIYRLATTSFELDALDLELANGEWCLVVRLAGLADGLDKRVERLQGFLVGKTETISMEQLPNAADYWDQISEFGMVERGQFLAKVTLSPRQILAFDQAIAQKKMSGRYIAGGNVAWVWGADVVALDETLMELDMVGLRLWGGGNEAKPFLGNLKGQLLAERVKRALNLTGFIKD